MQEGNKAVNKFKLQTVDTWAVKPGSHVGNSGPAFELNLTVAWA